jgi:hypothetical protein
MQAVMLVISLINGIFRWQHLYSYCAGLGPNELPDVGLPPWYVGPDACGLSDKEKAKIKGVEMLVKVAKVGAKELCSLLHVTWSVDSRLHASQLLTWRISRKWLSEHLE